MYVLYASAPSSGENDNVESTMFVVRYDHLLLCCTSLQTLVLNVTVTTYQRLWGIECSVLGTDNVCPPLPLCLLACCSVDLLFAV